MAEKTTGTRGKKEPQKPVTALKPPAKNDTVINVRLGEDVTKTEVAEFALRVYGIKTVSEFMRHILDYTMEHKPVLGKSFVPTGLKN